MGIDEPAQILLGACCLAAGGHCPVVLSGHTPGGRPCGTGSFGSSLWSRASLVTGLLSTEVEVWT